MFGIDDCIAIVALGIWSWRMTFPDMDIAPFLCHLHPCESRIFFMLYKQRYRAKQESWLSEGMAVWAEHLLNQRFYHLSVLRRIFRAHRAFFFESSVRRVRLHLFHIARPYGLVLQEKRGVDIMISRILEELQGQEDSSQAMFGCHRNRNDWICGMSLGVGTLRQVVGVGESYPYASLLHGGLEFKKRGLMI